MNLSEKNRPELYVFQKESAQILSTDLHIQKTRVTCKNAGFINTLYWNLISFFSARAYVVYDGKTLVHRSYVAHSRLKFPFMKKRDIHIGPCWTNPAYRGRGIYPMVLREIVRRERKKDGDVYMMVRSANEASKRGAAKAGFVKTGDIVIRDWLKRYTIARDRE